jgi:hypothetical protein
MLQTLKVIALVVGVSLLLVEALRSLLSANKPRAKNGKVSFLSWSFASLLAAALLSVCQWVAEYRQIAGDAVFQDESLANDGALLRKLTELGRDKRVELYERYPFGFVVFAPAENGYAHVPYLSTHGGTTVAIESPWEFATWHHESGVAYLQFDALAVSVKQAADQEVKANLATSMQVELRDGATQEAPEALAGKYRLVLEVLDADAESPAFAFGIRTVDEADAAKSPG